MLVTDRRVVHECAQFLFEFKWFHVQATFEIHPLKRKHKGIFQWQVLKKHLASMQPLYLLPT